jgi:hypothetical protein
MADKFTFVRYGVNRKDRSGRRPRMVHENHYAIVQGTPEEDPEFHELVKHAVKAEFGDGWNLTGYAPWEETLTGREVSALQEAILIAQSRAREQNRRFVVYTTGDRVFRVAPSNEVGEHALVYLSAKPFRM